MNINDLSDDEILDIAHPMWDELIKYSNKGYTADLSKNSPTNCCSA
jgi:hypothetical protein